MGSQRTLEPTWRGAEASAGSYTLGMLGATERKLIYHIAKDYVTGRGDVVDLGAFCGASASCLAEGLRANPAADAVKIHCYDMFIADQPYLVDFVRTHLKRDIELGQSFEPCFREAIENYADRIVVHSGNLLTKDFKQQRPIECLFVDVSKTLELNGHILRTFFTRLIPGLSTIIHQDFYHPPSYWLLVTMWRLRDYVTVMEPRADWSAAYYLHSPIPGAIIEEIARYPYSFEEQKAAIAWTMDQFAHEREYLVMSMAALIHRHRGARAFRKYLAKALWEPETPDVPIWDTQLAYVVTLDPFCLKQETWRERTISRICQALRALHAQGGKKTLT